MIATNPGERVWVRFRESLYSTEPPTWFLYERQGDDLKPIDSFDEPRRTFFPWGTWSYEQLFGPPSYTLPVGAEVDRAMAIAQADDIWMNWDGVWHRVTLQRAHEVATMLEAPRLVDAVRRTPHDPS